jgi:hypothetical protein
VLGRDLDSGSIAASKEWWEEKNCCMQYLVLDFCFMTCTVVWLNEWIYSTSFCAVKRIDNKNWRAARNKLTFQ